MCNSKVMHRMYSIHRLTIATSIYYASHSLPSINRTILETEMELLSKFYFTEDLLLHCTRKSTYKYSSSKNYKGTDKTEKIQVKITSISSLILALQSLTKRLNALSRHISARFRVWHAYVHRLTFNPINQITCDF